MVAGPAPADDGAMTQQTTQTPSPSGPQRLERFFDSLRAAGLYRRRDHRWIGGVCSGLATRLNVDPVLIRIAAVFLGLFFGVGITMYLVAWALLPDDGGTIHAERAWKERHAPSVILSIITLISVLNIGDGPGDRRDGPGGIVGAALAVGLWFLVTRRSSAPRVTPAADPTPYAAPAGSRPADPAAYPQDRRPGQPFVRTSGATGASADASTTGPPAVPAWTPPRPVYATPRGSGRRRTGGPFVLLLTAGLSVLAYQAARAAAVAVGVAGSPHLLGLAAVLGVLGVTLLLLGLAGRRGGLISPAAALLSIGLAGTSFGAAALDINPSAGYGNARWQPATVAELQNRYEWTAGDVVLDLSRLDPAALAGRHTTVDVGLGQLTVVVPEDAAATVTASLLRGQLTWEDDRHDQRREDASDDDLATTLTLAGATTGTAPITIDAGVRLGELRIEQR